jgi:hypothetical protein
MATNRTPARLDADRTARPLTRLVGHVTQGHCFGPGTVQPDALEVVATGERISLTPDKECPWCGCSTSGPVAGYLYCDDCGSIVGTV